MARKDETGFFKRWLFTSVGVLTATQIVPGIEHQGWPAILVTALLLGVFNAVFKPILFLLTLPIQIVTLGLFTLVINAMLLKLADVLVESLRIEDFWAAFFGALVISIVAGFLNLLFGGSGKTESAHVNTGQPPSSSSPNPPAGKGPIIDV